MLSILNDPGTKLLFTYASMAVSVSKLDTKAETSKNRIINGPIIITKTGETNQKLHAPIVIMPDENKMALTLFRDIWTI